MLVGADSRVVDDGFDIGIRKSWENAIREVEEAGRKPYPFPAVASVHELGGLGYVEFAEEVRAQAADLGLDFTTSLFASSPDPPEVRWPKASPRTIEPTR